MSWSITIPNTAPADFPAAADQAVKDYYASLENSDVDLDASAKSQVDAAVAALKTLVADGLLGDAPLSASIGGHSNPGFSYTEGQSPNAIAISITSAAYQLVQALAGTAGETAGGIDTSGPGEPKATSTTDAATATNVPVASDTGPPQVDSSGTPVGSGELNQAAAAGQTDAGASSGLTNDPAWTEAAGSPPAPAPEGDASIAATIEGEAGVPAPNADNAGGETTPPASA